MINLTSAAAETPSQRVPRLMMSGFRRRSASRTRPVVARPLTFGCCCSHRVRAACSVSTRAMTSAETIEASTPMDRVTPKPLIGPEPRKNSRPAASSVVTLESMIALQALLKPIWRA